jgi:hypothetical protein
MRPLLSCALKKNSISSANDLTNFSFVAILCIRFADLVIVSLVCNCFRGLAGVWAAPP